MRAHKFSFTRVTADHGQLKMLVAGVAERRRAITPGSLQSVLNGVEIVKRSS